VFAGKSDELVALGALGNLDVVLVGPLLDLAVGPRVEKRVTQALLSSGSGGRDLGVGTLGILAGKARLAAEAGNKRVTAGWLGNGVATLIEPSLDIRVGPRRVQPVTWVSGSLAKLGGGRLVVLADSLEEGVALAGLRYWDAVLVGEGFKLGVGPAVMC
jgi:hypothetical protein